MEATDFPSLREKWVFHKNDLTMTSKLGATYLNHCVAVLRICGCLHWLSRLIRSRVMVVRNFKNPTVVAFAGLNVTCTLQETLLLRILSVRYPG